MSIRDANRALPAAPPVLLATEDDTFAAFVIYVFQQIGVQVLREAGGRHLAKRLRDLRPAVLLLESRLPGLDVRNLCAQLRLEKETRSLFILVLLASGDERLQKELLTSGADECMARPLLPERLMAQVRAALHRSERQSGASSVLAFHDLEMDLTAYVVRRNGRPIHLAPTEFRLLQHFMRNPRRVHSRSELQSAAWPREVYLGARTVDVHVGRLRYALKSVGGSDLIRTVRSVGYALSEEVATPAAQRPSG